MSTKDYFVYILTNNSNDVLYVGVTNNLGRRLVEHKQHLVEGFTDEYNVTKLVYYERSGSVTDAIAREKQLKGWTRKKKFQLINSVNSELKDLSEEYSLLFEKD
uniref:GIY-YIG nuclease family protein n=1 Tax=Candidatus Fimenecus sp. TaxID=3022888 RepID=UPI004025CADF